MDDLIEKYQQITIKIKDMRKKLFVNYSILAIKSEDILSFITLENGAQPPKEQHIYEAKDGYIRFIQNRDYDSSNHITYIPISKRNHICKKDDIMMDKYGDAGAVRYGLTGAFNVALLKIQPKFSYMKEYIRDFLSQENIKNILYLSSQASTRPSLNESTFTGIQIPILSKNDFVNYERRLSCLLNYELETIKKIEKLSEIKSKLLEKYF